MPKRINKISFARITKRTQLKNKLSKEVIHHVVADCNRSITSIEAALACFEELDNLILYNKIQFQNKNKT